MREGWEIRKLGDLTTALNGLWVGKKPPFVNIAVIRNTNFTKDCKLDTTDIAYIDAEVKHFATRKLQCGDIIIEKSGGSDKQPVGRPVIFDIPEGDYSFSNFTSTLRINDQGMILPSFLHKALWAIYRSGKTASLQSKTTGIRNLDFKSYLKLPIPVPPIQEQEKIVAELDCLTGIIEKKKQQLEELDKLAQSIFYDMFGDPITDEKGWGTRAIQEVAPQTAYKGNIPSHNGKYWLLNLDMVEAQTGTILDEVLFDEKEIGGSTTTFNEEMVLYSKLRPYLNKVVLPMKPGYGTSELVPLLPDKSILNRVFLAYLLRSHSFVAFISLKVAGAKMPRVSLDVFRRFPVILPPLALQNEFAKKIETIEKQKELVKRSIVETETLFNSRMDYWFN